MASEDILPQSTERIVTVSGVIDSIHIATYHIGLVLQDHPERSAGTIFFKPMVGYLSSQGGTSARALMQQGPMGVTNAAAASISGHHHHGYGMPHYPPT
jgi:heterogeneous nuclear rnp K-like protein